MKHFFILAALLATTTISGCQAFTTDNEGEKLTPTERHEIALTKAQQGYVKAGNTFSYKLFEQVLKENSGSIMLSPLSVEYALAMLCNGAAGTTQEEILNLLGYKAGEMADVNEFCKYLTKELLGADNTVSMSLANALISNSAMARLKKGYTTTLETYYDALIKGYDFKIDNAAALSYINKWAEDKTNGMIKDLLDNLDPKTYLLLMNAIYFKGNWAGNVTFDKKKTQTGKFTKESGAKEDVDYMNQEIKNTYSYSETSLYQSLSLPYGNGAFSMSVYLPLEGKTVGDVLASLQTDNPPSYTYSGLANVKLKMPKFATENKINLKGTLASLGMKTAFSKIEADFSELAEDPTYVDFIFQKSRIKVYEEGTEAAAVTVVGMCYATIAYPQEPKNVEFYATRPFLYIIRETSTGAILFMGKYDGK